MPLQEDIYEEQTETPLMQQYPPDVILQQINACQERQKQLRMDKEWVRLQGIEVPDQGLYTKEIPSTMDGYRVFQE
ncbi:hypothetical protein FKM82_026478 [Ascaphus truei]